MSPRRSKRNRGKKPAVATTIILDMSSSDDDDSQLDDDDDSVQEPPPKVSKRTSNRATASVKNNTNSKKCPKPNKKAAAKTTKKAVSAAAPTDSTNTNKKSNNEKDNVDHDGNSKHTKRKRKTKEEEVASKKEASLSYSEETFTDKSTSAAAAAATSEKGKPLSPKDVASANMSNNGEDLDDNTNKKSTKSVSATMIAPAAARVVIDAPPVAMNYDSDEEPPVEDPKESLQWRGDPAVTLSDWKIEIVSTCPDGNGSNTVATYHVHKLVLSFGDRKSKYFANLFCRGSRYRESTNSKSRIELDPLSASCFPQLLDYIYKTDGKETLDINTETAAALYFLGGYFDIPRLRWDAKQFWKDDLTLDNATIYFEHSRIFQDDKILEGIAEILVKRIMEITPSSKIVLDSDCALWLSVLEKLDGNALEGAVTHLSEIIAGFAIRNIDDLDIQSFKLLTSIDKIPIISHKAALRLLHVEEKLSMSSTKDATQSKEPTSLRTRCKEALTSNWHEIENMGEYDLELLNRKDPLLAGLLTKVIAGASKELKEMTDKHAEANKKSKKEVKTLQSAYEYQEKETKKYRSWWLEEKDEHSKTTAKLNWKLHKVEVELSNTKENLSNTKAELKAAQDELATLRNAERERAGLAQLHKENEPPMDVVLEA